MDSLPSSQKEKQKKRKEKNLFRNTLKINKGESIFVTCRDLVQSIIVNICINETKEFYK